VNQIIVFDKPCFKFLAESFYRKVKSADKLSSIRGDIQQYCDIENVVRGTEVAVYRETVLEQQT
jgi:hypothetical protein